MGKKKREKERKGKRTRTGRKHENTQVYKFYEVKGDEVIRKKKSCPRCGPGTNLAAHKGRAYCGKCGYTEFDKKAEPVVKEKPAQPKDATEPKE